MKRLVGKGKKKAPPPTLEDTAKRFDERLGKLDTRVLDLDKKIKEIKVKMNKMPKNSPAYNQSKARALQLLRQRQMYEKQGDNARNQQFNIEQQNMNLEMMKATVDQVSTMAATKKEMKKNMKKINIDKVQDLKDDVDEIMEENNEIQDILGENDMLNDMNEEDLDAQLDAFDEFDDALIDTKDEVPAYLQDSALPSSLPAAPHGTADLNEFGLPSANPTPIKQANAL